jgi:hypothetical protein
MEKLDYNKILDTTLDVLLKATSETHIPYDFIFDRNTVLINLSNRDKLAVIEKLIKDGYVIKMPLSMDAFNNYYITLEGILFINSGGYISKQNKELQLKIWNKTKNVFLVIGTISASIIAILQSYQICRDFDNPPKKTIIEGKACKVNTQASQKVTVKEYKKTK